VRPAAAVFLFPGPPRHEPEARSAKGSPVSTVLRLAAAVAVFVTLLLLALSNTEAVTIRLFGAAVFESPLAFVVFAAFAAGVAAGLVAGAIRVARLKRSLARLRRRDRPLPPAPHGAVPEPPLTSVRAVPPDVA